MFYSVRLSVLSRYEPTKAGSPKTGSPDLSVGVADDQADSVVRPPARSDLIEPTASGPRRPASAGTPRAGDCYVATATR